MKPLLLTPVAPVLLESMRAIGYEPASAIADLIDNSITARAKSIAVRFAPGAPKALAIIDDGLGMDRSELVRAMRHGSRSPSERRDADDLGRFGLGLKTASLSQCKRLTVITRQGRSTLALVWDLDFVKDQKDWTAGELEQDEIERLPFYEEFSQLQHGTMVVWEKLDRLAAGDPGSGSVLSDRMIEVADHLALVFHRYLSGARFSITINNQPVRAIDPFLEGEGSEAGPEETIRVEGCEVSLRAFTLPHISRLSRAQIEKAGGELGLRRQQGFYVYRNRRLLVWGTWFRMFKQEELTKLTRVRVDIPNALDHLWSLDIKKSAASPPPVLRDRLRSLVPTMVRESRKAHQYRGAATKRLGITPIWKRIEDRDGIRYEIDLEHPVVAGLRSSADDGLLGDLDAVFAAISMSLPVESLYNDRAMDRMGHRSDYTDDAKILGELEELARQTLSAFKDRPDERARILNGLVSIEPFSLHPKITEKIRERLS
jgi:hypothetical protein